MGILVYSSLWVMQELYHQAYAGYHSGEYMMIKYLDPSGDFDNKGSNPYSSRFQSSP